MTVLNPLTVNLYEIKNTGKSSCILTSNSDKLGWINETRKIKIDMIIKLRTWFENLKLTSKLTVFFSLILLLIMIFIQVYFPAKQKQSVYKEMNQRITNLARSMALGYGAALSDEKWNPIYMVGNWVKNDKNFAYYCVLDENNEVIDSFPDEKKINTNPALTDSQPHIDDNYIVVKEPIHYKDEDLGYIILAMNLDGVKEEIRQINITSYITILILFLFGIAVMFFVSSLINKPVKMLMNSVNRIISHGDYSERVGITTRDEVGILAKRFDEMIEIIETRDIELKQQYQELEEVNKMRDEFLAVTTHDLRSPITAIMGFADLIELNEDLDPGDRNRVKHIKSSADFLASLVNDVLEIGRLQSGKIELKLKPMEPAGIIRSSIDTLHYMALPKEISIRFVDKTLETSKSPEFLSTIGAPVKVNADRDALLRVINNLVSNAVKFTPTGGNIEVVMDLVRDNHPENDSQYVIISVTDTGIGIPKSKIPLLFQTYSPVSRTGTAGEKSTGLGLSITKSLVEKHGGSIAVTSKEGEGSCFTIHIPRCYTAEDNQVNKKT